MAILRHATADDAALITRHRHLMFAENQFATEERLQEMDLRFEPWVRTHLAGGRYVGLFFEDDSIILAGAGVFFAEFPPHFMDPAPVRAYLLNFYTTPQARGHGFASRLLQLAVEECRARDVSVATLHASPFGRPVYEKFGFTESNEMLFRPPPAR